MKVKIFDSKPLSVLVFNAMCEESEDLIKDFGIKPEDIAGDNSVVELTTLVNGKPIDLEGAFTRALSKLFEDYENNVKEAAIDLIGASRVRVLADAIEAAEFQINDALNQLKEK